jgi:rod shape-determining protein MreC
MALPIIREGAGDLVRGRSYVVYGLLALTVIVLLNLPLPASIRLRSGVRDGVAPFQSVLSAMVSSVRDSRSRLKDSVNFAREKERLLEEIENLKLQIRLQRGLEKDNAELRSLLGFRQSYRYRLVLAEVVSRGDASGWWETARLNRGSSSGIGPGMAVITPEGLVGRTTAVSRQTTDILLITDPNCKIACKLGAAGSFGIVRGNGISVTGARDLAMLYTVPACRMDFIHRDADIASGTTVVTSEKSGVYPEGLTVGHVRETVLDPSRLFRHAEVIPAADLSTLRYVFVVLGEGAAGGSPSSTVESKALDALERAAAEGDR